jgi:hypothetical protein
MNKREMAYLMFVELVQMMIVDGALSYCDIIDWALASRGMERELFARAYMATSSYAGANIGYVAGYYSLDEAHQIHKIFDVEHPILGRM